jgi:Sugar (and other) transporter
VAALDQWRLVLASAMVPVVPLFILIYLCPESPRFLIRKNRYREAYDSLRRFRKTEIQACRDLYAIHSQLQIEAEIVRRDLGDNRNWYSHEVYQDEVRDMHYWQRIHRLVTRRRNLRASVSSCLCMAAQQLCGVGCFAACSRLFNRRSCDPSLTLLDQCSRVLLVERIWRCDRYWSCLKPSESCLA